MPFRRLNENLPDVSLILSRKVCCVRIEEGEEKQKMASDPNIYTLEEVVSHNKTEDCWLVISGKVYDVIPFMDDHPGGDEVLLTATGKDATDDFEAIGHSDIARRHFKQ